MHRCWRRVATEADCLLLAFLCLFLAEKVFAQNQTETPRADAFVRWFHENVVGGKSVPEPKTLALGLDLAQQRRTEMRKLMEVNPQAFIQRAMTDSELASLPFQMQPLFEKHVKGR